MKTEKLGFFEDLKISTKGKTGKQTKFPKRDIHTFTNPGNAVQGVQQQNSTPVY